MALLFVSIESMNAFAAWRPTDFSKVAMVRIAPLNPMSTGIEGTRLNIFIRRVQQRQREEQLVRRLGFGGVGERLMHSRTSGEKLFILTRPSDVKVVFPL